MSITTVHQLRQAFLDYFAKQGHAIVPSSPLVPHNDPTLMFTNSGMVQFKDMFTGLEKRDYTRAASSQKCVRAGGKHNDLDNVGYTARHHTFFEMLGNFSFGDYFKEEAITYAWEFLTSVLALSKEKLYITVYHTDDQAIALWKKIAGLDDSRIIRIATSDNFWSMGETGPCGPCSEIFYDHGADIFGGLPGTPDGDGDRYIEIWNLVFTQYNQQADGTRIEIPRPCIDTGSGMERLAAVLQGVHNNYEIDLFQHIIQATASALGVRPTDNNIASFRVIADHLRSSSFLIADGVMPSNEGRGYVLRRIMRRAMRHANQLGAKEALMHRIFPALVDVMGGHYHELERAGDAIIETLRMEEERFGETLARGLKLLEQETATLSSGDRLAGEVGFKLYDTYGFPADLTKDILRARGLTLDEAGFNVCMQAQRELARKSWVGSGDKATSALWFQLHEAHGATEFLGHETLNAEAIIVALVHEGEPVTEVGLEQNALVLTNQTPFYAESGGQEGDHGTLSVAGQIHQVHDTKKFLGLLHAHQVTTMAPLKVGDTVQLHVDGERRRRLQSNHSATHILHAVLRARLGNHITQKGSLVAADRLRFDISHPRAIARDDLDAIETEVNDIIRRNSNVRTRLLKPEEAIAEGAMALFGEKYGEIVRVVSMAGISDANASLELCGGTHVADTGNIGAFKIISESAVAAGVRRIEAVTGPEALTLWQQQAQTMATIAERLKSGIEELPARIDALLDERKQLQKQLEAWQMKSLAQIATTVKPEEVAGQRLICLHAEAPAKALRPLAEDILRLQQPAMVVVISTQDDKTAVVAVCDEGTAARISAVTCAQAASQALGGSGGGGKPTMAQAGGPVATSVEPAFHAVRTLLQAL